MDRVGIALAAFFGGMLSGYLGWLESGEPFDARKYLATIIRSILGGLVFAVGYQFADDLSVIDLFYAALGGAGVDALVNRASGKLAWGSFPISKRK